MNYVVTIQTTDSTDTYTDMTGPAETARRVAMTAVTMTAANAVRWGNGGHLSGSRNQRRRLNRYYRQQVLW